MRNFYLCWRIKKTIVELHIKSDETVEALKQLAPLLINYFNWDKAYTMYNIHAY